MLLILTNSQDATADYLAERLKEGGVRYLRFDTDTCPEKLRLSGGTGEPSLTIDGLRYAPGDFTNVWYRRPERMQAPIFDDTPEGRFVYREWAEALEGFLAHIPAARWMNHPARNVGASHKIEQLSTARRLGLQVPDTLVTQDAGELRAFAEKNGGRIIVKPMALGKVESPNGETDSVIYTNMVPAAHLERLDDLGACPTLFQSYIDKVRDVRITVVDAAIHPVALLAEEPDGSQRCDIRRNDMDDVRYELEELPGEVIRGLQLLVAHYGLRFAAIDMVVDRAGRWYFLEVNPNGQWAWLDLAAGVDIARAFITAFRD